MNDKCMPLRDGFIMGDRDDMGTPSIPPPQQPPRPWQDPSRVPTTPVPQSGTLVISKRLLWVNGAAYPLENITRVYTFVLTPRRLEAFLQFLKRGGVTVLALLVLAMLSDLTSSGSSWDSGSGSDSGPGGVMQLLLWLAVGLLIYFFGAMISVVFASSHDVLAIETNGQSTALVAGEPQRLKALVGEIAETIDKPDANFQTTIQTLSISNIGNYQFGDSVNIYGGSGHTGVAK